MIQNRDDGLELLQVSPHVNRRTLRSLAVAVAALVCLLVAAVLIYRTRNSNNSSMLGWLLLVAGIFTMLVAAGIWGRVYD
jgi:high-affinity Fe2+/Pb2+ permease